MTITFDGQNYNIPSGLHEITLQQHIDWMRMWGNALEYRRRELLQIPEADWANPLKSDSNVLRDAEQAVIFYDLCCQQVSFFAGIPLERVENEMEFSQVLNVASTIGLIKAQQEYAIEVEQQYDWQQDTWVITPPYTDVESATHAEFTALMKIAKAMYWLGNGDWEQMLPIAAAYFRKQGEAFDPAWLQKGNARYETMRTLPLDYALAIGYYVQTTLTAYLELINEYIADQGTPQQP